MKFLFVNKSTIFKELSVIAGLDTFYFQTDIFAIA